MHDVEWQPRTPFLLTLSTQDVEILCGACGKVSKGSSRASQGVTLAHFSLILISINVLLCVTRIDVTLSNLYDEISPAEHSQRIAFDFLPVHGTAA